jgi:hypothetical protein
VPNYGLNLGHCLVYTVFIRGILDGCALLKSTPIRSRMLNK